MILLEESIAFNPLLKKKAKFKSRYVTLEVLNEIEKYIIYKTKW
jgi:hypothetical protein